MAVSGSTDFSVDRNTLIQDSMRLVGALEAGETPEAQEINDASRALNMMMKYLHAKNGLPLWMKREQSITLVDDQRQYTLGPTGDVVMDRPMRLLKVIRRDSSDNDIELHKLSQDEYWEQTPKTINGTPNSYFYDPQLTNGVLNVWPVPGTTEATEFTLQILYLKPIDDMDSATDDFEIPQEWYEVLKYGLALRLAPEYGLPIQERRELRRDYLIILEGTEDFDVEDSSVYFQPDRRDC